MASYTVVPEPLRLEGGAGAVEALLELPAAVGADGGVPVLDPAPRSVAICCHPHPLYGGSLSNKVIHTVARAFVSAGVPALRFNFRGVGASAGSYDEGRGETDDLLAVIRAGRARLPGLPLWLGGFSFGSFVALRAQAAGVPEALLCRVFGGRPPESAEERAALVALRGQLQQLVAALQRAADPVDPLPSPNPLP
jgi:alpha/beta superfamily hydrolase